MYNNPFRTGNSKEISSIEILHQSLNEQKGSAYNTETNSVVWVENYALAKVLADAWETSRRFANQFDPLRLTSFLERWERILKITPFSTDSLESRRKTIQGKWKLFNVIPNSQIIKDFLLTIIGSIFLNILHVPSSKAKSYINHGHSPIQIPGGVLLLDGSWKSSISTVLIRVYQPTNMQDSEFFELSNKCKPFLDNLLPAHIIFDWGMYGENQGTISVAGSDVTVTGFGTQFITGVCGPVLPGDEIEFYDDLGKIRTHIVFEVLSETSLNLTVPVLNSVTQATFKRFGFYLDTRNLDMCFLD